MEGIFVGFIDFLFCLGPALILSAERSIKETKNAPFHGRSGKEHSLFVLLIFFALASILTARFNRRSIKETKNALFHARSGKEHSLFVLLIFFALASILTARFNRRSIKETKNALFHARSGNGPLGLHMGCSFMDF